MNSKIVLEYILNFDDVNTELWEMLWSDSWGQKLTLPKIKKCFTEFIFVNSSPYVISMIKSLFFNKDILYPTQSDIIESHDLSQSRFIDVSTYKI